MAVLPPFVIRYRWRIFALALLVVILSTSPLIYSWLEERYAPFRMSDSQCMICGRLRSTFLRNGRLVYDRIFENEASNWIDSFIPKDHQHAWGGGDTTWRHEWFGGTNNACSDGVGPYLLNHARPRLGEERARELVRKLYEVYTSGTPEDRMTMEEELADAIFPDRPKESREPIPQPPAPKEKSSAEE